MHRYTLYGIKVTSDVQLLCAGAETTCPEGSNKNSLEITLCSGKEISNCPLLVDELELSGGHYLLLFSDRKTVSNDIGRPWFIEVKNIVRFGWVGGGSTLSYQILARGSVHHLAYWCVHMVLPMFKAFTQGEQFFHASSVEFSNGAVLFMAPSFGGKSTLAYHATLRGARLLSDDKVMIQRESSGYLVVPSHPCSRPDRAVESLGLPVTNYSAQAAPLLAVYILEQRDEYSTPHICELENLRKMEVLLQHRLYDFRMKRRDQLSFIAGLAESTPVFSFGRPWGMDNIQSGLECLEQHAASLWDIQASAL